MKQVDYMIVGLGIAGMSFCEELIENNKSFVVFNHNNNGATKVSGGVYNPVVLKRFTPAWNGKQLLTVAMPFYKKLSRKLKQEFLQSIPVHRIFTSVEEQNNWLVASDKKELKEYLSSSIVSNTNKYIQAPFGLGEVYQTGKIATEQLLAAYQDYLETLSCIVTEKFDYKNLQIEDDLYTYGKFLAKKIIFSEGAAAIHNPFFPKQHLIGNKGEYLIIDAPKLKLNTILKGPMFVIPLGNDLYKVGATYNRENLSLIATEFAKEKIIAAFSKMIQCPFTIKNQVVGVRPTTKDRKPLLGNHSNYINMCFFNGLGTRGIMSAPWLAKILYKHIEQGKELPSELDINRFS